MNIPGRLSPQPDPPSGRQLKTPTPYHMLVTVEPPPTHTHTDAFEGKGPPRRPQKRLDRRLEGVAKAVGGGYCRLQTPLRLALGIGETAAGHRLGALEGEGEFVYLSPFQCIPASPPPPFQIKWGPPHVLSHPPTNQLPSVTPRPSEGAVAHLLQCTAPDRQRAKMRVHGAEHGVQGDERLGTPTLALRPRFVSPGQSGGGDV